MAEPTAPGVVETERYRPCKKCTGCVAGRPLGGEPAEDDCWALYLKRVATTLGIREPQQ